jgi:hypothetical protein
LAKSKHKKATKAKSAYKFHLHPKLTVFLAIVILFSIVYVAFAKTTGFDEFGYNRTARIFQGPADGVDKILDGAYWGNTLYAKDQLKMKWNAEWDRGNLEGWGNPPYSAHLDNSWNGKVPGGSGETWHYKFAWVGPCGADGTVLPSGGYCIWGQFAVIMSQGSVGNQHFWDAHANPSGFGAY